jgi:hypothetical protein
MTYGRVSPVDDQKAMHPLRVLFKIVQEHGIETYMNASTEYALKIPTRTMRCNGGPPLPVRFNDLNALLCR